jgi:hypothetical protein
LSWTSAWDLKTWRNNQKIAIFNLHASNLELVVLLDHKLIYLRKQRSNCSLSLPRFEPQSSNTASHHVFNSTMLTHPCWNLWLVYPFHKAFVKDCFWWLGHLHVPQSPVSYFSNRVSFRHLSEKGRKHLFILFSELTCLFTFKESNLLQPLPSVDIGLVQIPLISFLVQGKDKPKKAQTHWMRIYKGIFHLL